MKRQHYYSGAKWEKIVGYSRAVRVGSFIEVAGTVAAKEGEIMYPKDAYRQSQYIFGIIRKALEELGASMEDVVRTRMFVTDISEWEGVGRAHAECFADICPASTMLEVSALVHEDLVVEIEVSAIISE